MSRIHHQVSAAYEGRTGEGRADPYPQQQHYPTSAQPSFQPPPPLSPPSSSPFAFAPPPLGTTVPLGGTSRPPLVSHHSDPSPVVQPISYPFVKQQQKLPPPASHHASYPYVSSIPMSYRSYSGDSGRNSPQSLDGRGPAPSNNPSTHSGSISAQSSPLPSNLQYQRQMLPGSYEAPMGQMFPDSNRAATYPQGYYNPVYASALSTEMPRSLSYPSGYSQPYSYIPSLPSPTSFHPPIPGYSSLTRHHTLGTGPSYAFGSRQPVQDRPFKCDECLQSFNRNHDLKRHKRIHLSVKPFGCEKCGKTFSRKDALRRHWLVKGCRGSEGATAPIMSLYPLSSTSSQPPALSPPTPTSLEQLKGNPITDSSSSSRSSTALPPLTSLPQRQSADQSQIILTPCEPSGLTLAQATAPLTQISIKTIDPAIGNIEVGSGSGSAGSMGEGFTPEYFDSAVPIKSASVMSADARSNVSPFSSTCTSPPESIQPQPYRRSTLTLASDGTGPSPSSSYKDTMPIAPSNLGAEGKPVFSTPFTPTAQSFAMQQQGTNASQTSSEANTMERQASSDKMPETWQRWHRPSFPFPAPPGISYVFDPSSPMEATDPSYVQ
ncbi:specific RNA polymerase II transcription factor [Cryptococcus neoformans Tu401-1]|nr:specific RNA polymerase II transcription factor [Cryptococcus neoformans var. grubii Bt85]OXG24534.1 specific RNA polymerase II transcription factor [Cryptococcus neoformans var. grubii Tu401-1]OXM81957.1 specific RNA polymerase II transcription factor [Cryptococcus neoformans var. grubii Bt63]